MKEVKKYMENIIDYIRWRGDLSMNAVPFQEIDSLILSLISYVNLDDIVPGIDTQDHISLKEASEIFWNLHSEEEVLASKSLNRLTPLLLRDAAQTIRFGNIRIGKYANTIDLPGQKQFAALTLLLDDQSIYIAFRGTDDSIVGWKEDFNMSFLPEVPAQTDAVQYLERIYNWSYQKIRLGGHSKGGNLAIYAGIKCRKQIQESIVSIDSFDGPGFCKDLIECNACVDMAPKITNYVPQSSVIGMLLEHNGKQKIIESNQKGIMQHDAFSWGIRGPQFSYLKKLDKHSVMLDGVIKEWICKLDNDQRKCFVDTLFGVLDENGVETMAQLQKISNARMKIFLHSISTMPEETRKILLKAVRIFFNESRKVVQKDLNSRFETILKIPKKKSNKGFPNPV